MKSMIASALLLVLASPAFAQTATPAPAAQPSITQKATEAASAVAGKVLGKPADAKVARVNINTASPAALDALPQIGEARTKAIVAGRPYKDAKELLDRKIVPANVYDAIKDKIAVK